MNESIPELQEEFAEIIPTVQEGTIIAGVQSINGKAGDLDLKTINNTDLLTAGNLNLATSAQLSDLEAVVEGKQDQLSDTQLAAVNSGIDSTKVAQITTNKNNITTINGKIPAQATSTNKLADKNFVNSSIATNTANYISNNGQPFTSVAQLEAYTGTVTNNDYAFVTGTDSAGNTYYDRYKATVVGSTVTWAKEYRLNNSSFTSDQWTAINSGATTGLIEQITTNQNDIATLQTDKQDKLIAGTNIQIAADGKTISATDTKYTAGTGLTLTGTQFSVTEPVPAGFFTDTAGTQEGEGTQFTLNNTTDAPIDGAELKGNTAQTTYTGKNIFNKNATPDTTSQDTSVSAIDTGVRVTVSATTSSTKLAAYILGNVSSLIGKKIVGSAKMRASGNNAPRLSIGVCKSDGSDKRTIVVLNETGSISYTIASSDVSERPYAYIYVYANNGGSAQPGDYIDYTDLQLEIRDDSTPTAYEPYTGSTPTQTLPSPNPDYPQDIQVVTGSQTVTVTGKNLFLIEDGTISNNGVEYVKSGGVVSLTGAATANSSPTLASTFFNAKANTTYTLSANNPVANSGVRLRLRTPSGTISSFQLTTANASVQWTPTADTQVKPEIYLPNGTSIGSTPFIVKPMLELGSTATAYQPYQSQSYTIDLGSTELAKIGAYRDYIWKDGADWKVHKEIGKQTYDGSVDETWNKLNYCFQTNAPADKGPAFTCLSDHFTYNSMTVGITSSLPNGQFGFNTIKVPTFRYDTASTADDFKDWLALNPTSIYYRMDTATDTTITDAALIAQLEALASSTTYAPQTNYTTAGTGTNLPVILTVDVFKNNYAGLLARLEKAGA